jgi:hypothetical protein
MGISKDLLAFGQEFISLCHGIDISPVVYGSLACLVHLKDSSLNVNDIDFLVREADFPKLIEASRRLSGLRFEPTDYHSIKFYRAELKVAFDAIEHYLKGIKIETKRTTINGHAFEILGINPLKESYRRAALSIPVKVEAYREKLRMLETP